MNEHDDTTRITRRHALGGAAGLGLALPLLAACSGSGASTDDGSGAGGSRAASGGGAGGGNASGGAAGGGGGQVLGPASDVPVGGGAIFADARVVVTQPTQGDYRGFSSICTHQGCPVTSISNGTINCACHGSEFSIEDGSVKRGPATRPLGTVQVSVSKGQISEQ